MGVCVCMHVRTIIIYDLIIELKKKIAEFSSLGEMIELGGEKKPVYCSNISELVLSLNA